MSLLLPILLLAQSGDAHIQKLIKTLPIDAADFVRSSARVYSDETLQHRIFKTPHDFEKHELVSHYSFTGIRGRIGVIREVRMLTTVDGKAVKKARGLDAIAAAVASGSNEEKQVLMKQLERYGIRSVATDIGQLLLLFTDSSILNYEFEYETLRQDGDREPVLVFSYKQIDGQAAATVYNKKNPPAAAAPPDPNRAKLSGQIWINQRDFRLARVTLETIVPAAEGGGTARQEMEVDYLWNPAAGCLLPSEARHKEFLDGQLHVENVYRYAPFRTLERK